MDNKDKISFDCSHDAIAIKLDGLLDDVAANLPGMDFDSSDDDNDEDVEIFQRSDLFPLQTLDDNDNDLNGDGYADEGGDDDATNAFDAIYPSKHVVVDSEIISDFNEDNLTFIDAKEPAIIAEDTIKTISQATTDQCILNKKKDKKDNSVHKSNANTILTVPNIKLDAIHNALKKFSINDSHSTYLNFSPDDAKSSSIDTATAADDGIMNRLARKALGVEEFARTKIDPITGAFSCAEPTKERRSVRFYGDRKTKSISLGAGAGVDAARDAQRQQGEQVNEPTKGSCSIACGSDADIGAESVNHLNEINSKFNSDVYDSYSRAIAGETSSKTSSKTCESTGTGPAPVYTRNSGTNTNSVETIRIDLRGFVAPAPPEPKVPDIWTNAQSVQQSSDDSESDSDDESPSQEAEMYHEQRRRFKEKLRLVASLPSESR